MFLALCILIPLSRLAIAVLIGSASGFPLVPCHPFRFLSTLSPCLHLRPILVSFVIALSKILLFPSDLLYNLARH